MFFSFINHVENSAVNSKPSLKKQTKSKTNTTFTKRKPRVVSDSQEEISQILHFLTTSYVVIVVLKIAQLLSLFFFFCFLFSICWNNSYFVRFRHISTNEWWNSSLAWDLKSRSEHLRRKHVKMSSHDSLSSLGSFNSFAS